MVFIKRKFNPDITQATLQVTLSTSPTLSLSDQEASLAVTLRLRIVHAKEANTPITFCISRSAFETFGDEGVDMFARGAFGVIRGVDKDNQATDKRIVLGLFRVNERWPDILDLRERGLKFLTIPGDGSEVPVTHQLNWERIFRHEEKLSKDDLKPGERFRIRLNEGYIGTSWWRYGDLESDLKNKRFHPWVTGQFGDERPDDKFLEEGNWVVGRDPMLLHWTYYQPDDNKNNVFEVVK